MRCTYSCRIAHRSRLCNQDCHHSTHYMDNTLHHSMYIQYTLLLRERERENRLKSSIWGVYGGSRKMEGAHQETHTTVFEMNGRGKCMFQCIFICSHSSPVKWIRIMSVYVEWKSGTAIWSCFGEKAETLLVNEMEKLVYINIILPDLGLHTL